MTTKKNTPLTPEQVMAERDALILAAATAHTVGEHLAVLAQSAQVEQAEQVRDERNALITARLRGAAIWGAYVGTLAERGKVAETPIDTKFSVVRDTLGIPDRPKTGQTGTPWQGLAYQTLEQAYAFHQFSPEDGWREQAYDRFLATADAEQVKYLGGRPSSLIGRLTFARRVAKGEDGIVVPTSGKQAERVSGLVEQVLNAANAKLSERSAAEQVERDTRIALIERADSGSASALVAGVGGLSAVAASLWTDEQIDSVITALRMLKGRERTTDSGEQVAAPAQAEQAEQVAKLAEQAEQVAAPRSALSLLSPEQIAALSPEQVAALA